MTFDVGNHYFSGQGVVMIGQKDPTTGAPTGLRQVGNVSDLKISIATTVIDHKGSQDGQRAIDARLQTETKGTASVTLESWDRANLAKALRGDFQDIVAGTAFKDTVTVLPGLVTALTYIQVTNVVVKQSAATLVAYTTAGTKWDYKLNAAAGSILMNDGTQDGGYSAYVPAGGGLMDTLTVTYDYAKQKLVNALTQPLNDSWLRFEGLNTLDGNNPVVVDVFRFVNDPLKELALISDTFGQFALEGALLKDDTRASGSKYFTSKQLM